MSQTAKIYLAVMPSGQIEFSVEGPMVGGQVLNAFYLTERDARALYSQLGSVLGRIDGVLPVQESIPPATQPERSD
jgi:hypothetical protein